MGETTALTEQCADWRCEARVQRAQRLVTNVALAGASSKNGYRYSESALREGARLYERKPVFLDHAPDRRRPQERSARDLVGSIVHPRFEAGRIRGDIQVLDTEAGQTFLSLVESDAPGVGMSHVVLAERGGDGATVERIHDVISVDAVVGPATTTTFREAVDDAAAAVVDGGPHRDEALERLQGRLQELIVERDALAARVAEFEQRGAREAAARECAERSGLPAYAVTPVFVGQLAAADEAGRRQLISERRELLARAVEARPHSAARRDAAGSRSSEAAFVAAIRGMR